MRNFKSDSRSRGGRYSPRRSFGGRDSRRSEMHDAVCDECGKDCQVPFRPSGDKPVYCSDCFEKKGGRDRDSDRPSRRDSRRGDSRDRGLGRSSPSSISDRSMSQFIEKIDILNTKLDTIIDLLSSIGKKKPQSVKAKAKKNKKTKKSKAGKGTEVLTPVKKKKIK